MNNQPGDHHAPEGASAPSEGLTRPLPNDVSQGWMPEDTRQRPLTPLPGPKLFRFQSLLPFKFANAIRHPGELPWLISAYGVTLFTYIGVGIYFLTSFIPDLMAIEVDETTGTASNIGLMVQLTLLAVYLPLLLFLVRAFMYAQIRVNAVRISPTQFPEAYQMIVEAARAAGLRRVPDAYVMLGNGQINAFASGHGHRRFIVIYSDLFEIGGAPRNPNALRFIIGHEVGHIAAGHVSYFRLIFTSLFMQLPLVGSILSRTQEYTADNYGYRFCPQGAPEVTGVLAAGKYLMNEVNFDEYANRAVYEGGFFTWIANLNASHPVGTWRAHALRDRSEPGRLIWRPKNNPPYPLSMIPAAEPAETWADPLQATDYMATYPENPNNQHFGIVQVEQKVPARHRDRRVADMLETQWAPPHIREERMRAAQNAPQSQGQGQAQPQSQPED
ncbi:M48 family metallopeptidase [Rothia sp. ZJ932]|uniref:M48 family metallopeptidase n=1 Tax=Rothia sp. ZJ932 TaxID=2810516 RepID=UPI001F083962|nr:M48 family metallopeptidase [Rothia sp. ZJ932]